MFPACVTGSLGGVPVDLFMVGPSGAPPRDPITQRGNTIWAMWGRSWDQVWAFGGFCRVPPWFLELKNEPEQKLPFLDVYLGGT